MEIEGTSDILLYNSVATTHNGGGVLESSEIGWFAGVSIDLTMTSFLSSLLFHVSFVSVSFFFLLISCIFQYPESFDGFSSPTTLQLIPASNRGGTCRLATTFVYVMRESLVPYY